MTNFVTVNGDYYCYDLEKKGLFGLKDPKEQKAGVDKVCRSSRGKRSALIDEAVDRYEIEN